MIWWVWIVIGLVLIAVEFTMVDAAFYLLFLGLAAIATGTIVSVGAGIPAAMHWAAFTVTAIALTVLFRRKLYDKLRGNPIGFEDQVDGRHVDVLEDVRAGAETRVAFRGSRWTAVNVGNTALREGDQALIVRTEGSLLKIEALPEPDTANAS
ncbi:MAG: NfeD family protein [Pseudomonadota bacterium]